MNLSKRERQSAIVLAGCVALWMVFMLVIRPAWQRIETLNRIIPETEVVMEQLAGNAREYRHLDRQMATLKKEILTRPEQNPREYINLILKKSDLANKAQVTTTPKGQNDRFNETRVEIHLTQITPDELSQMITSLVNDNTSQIEKVTITPDKKNSLEISAQISAGVLSINQ